MGLLLLAPTGFLVARVLPVMAAWRYLAALAASALGAAGWLLWL